MQYRLLGKTGLTTSVLGLGTGTRFGDDSHHPQARASRLVRTALDLGINYIDTAAIYGEAEIMLGRALTDVPRDRFIVATKFFPTDPTGTLITPAQLRVSVERSLQRLRLDTLDILQIHGVRPHWLQPTLATLGEELDALQRAGKYRFLGIAETILEDPRHEMLPRAAATGRFSSALVAYSLLSPWAEIAGLPCCRQQDIGVVAMVAVRRALRDPAMLRELVRSAHTRGELLDLREDEALNWLLDEHAPNLAAAGYRFAAANPAVSCVLAGTLNLDHLKANVAAVCAPSMCPDHLSRLRSLFLSTKPENWIPFNL